MAQVRHTVCVSPVGLQTSNIQWNDAEHAASVGAPCVSPHKFGSFADHEWVRTYDRACYALKISGHTSAGYREWKQAA